MRVEFNSDELALIEIAFNILVGKESTQILNENMNNSLKALLPKISDCAAKSYMNEYYK